MRSLTARTGLLVLFAALLLAGCSRDASRLGPPQGWSSNGDRWWKEGAPLNEAFRDLGSLASMNIRGAEMAYIYADELDLPRDSVPVEQRQALLKRSMLRLYRTQPEVIDSLFEQYVAPIVEQAPAHADLRLFIREARKEGYKAIQTHFREPYPVTDLGHEVPVPYPDSLRKQLITGSVRTQVYLNQDGEPEAIMLLNRVHPVLDSLAMRATTQMRWEPAARLERGHWKTVPSWTRFNISFGALR